MIAISRLAATVAGAAVLGLAAGCGGDGDSTPAEPGTSVPAASTPQTTGLAPATTTRPPATTTTTAPASGTTTAAPAAGTTFGGENMSAADATALQAAVDQGHQPWRLDVASVAETFVKSRFGWTDADVKLADPHTAEVTDNADGRMVTLQLRQPARAGEGGIWVVISGVWLN